MKDRTKTVMMDPQIWRALVGILVFLGLWYLLTAVLALPRFKLIPDPVTVIKEWVSFEPLSGRSIFTREYYLDMAYSVVRTLVAFVLATILGVSLGLFMGWNRTFYDFTFPLVEIMRPMPPLSWIPLAVLILPGVEIAVIYVTFIAAFFATVLNTLLGVLSIDRNYFLAAKCLGSKPKDIFFNVVVPGSLPFIFTGLQIAMGVSWMSLVAGEIISGQRGLGYAIYEGYSLFQYSQVVSYMFTLGILGYISSAGIRAVGRKLMAWEAGRRGVSVQKILQKQGAISIRDVTKIYDPEGANVMAMKECSFEIEAGEFAVIVGPSGCGKTTLLNAIAGFDTITSGEISLDGEIISSRQKQIKPNVDRMVVFQNGALFPWKTVMENIIYGPVVQGSLTKPQAMETARELLEQLGLQGIENKYPEELSSGVQRRVEILRALINEPRVVMLDEPFRGLDAVAKTVMHEFLMAVYCSSPRTMFFITHDIDEAIFLGTKVIIMTTRPALVKKIVPVNLPWPREHHLKGSAAYLELKREVLEAVHEEAKKAFEAGEREMA